MPSDGSLAILPKMTVNTTMVRNGRHQRPGDADHRLLVAHRHVAPGQDLEQLAIAPEVAPVIALLAAGLDDQLVHLRFQPAETAWLLADTVRKIS